MVLSTPLVVPCSSGARVRVCPVAWESRTLSLAWPLWINTEKERSDLNPSFKGVGRCYPFGSQRTIERVL